MKMDSFFLMQTPPKPYFPWVDKWGLFGPEAVPYEVLFGNATNLS